MYKENVNQITVKTVLDKRIARKNSIYPIKVQVVHRRLQKYYLTGKTLSEKDWKKLSEARGAEMVKIRNSIKSSFDLVFHNVEELSQKGEFSFDALSVRLGRTSGGSINASLKIKIETLKSEARIGTMSYYECILSCVEKYAGKDIPVENVTVDWLKKFEAYMLNNGMAYSSIGMYMRGLRAIMNQFKKDGIIKESQYPFGKDKYEIKTGESRKKALTLKQLGAISTYNNGNATTNRYRDIWLFVYLCNGINVADLVKLKYKQIVDGEIFYVREKTKRTSRNIKEIRSVITPEMQEIIDRWGNEVEPENYIFPLITHTDDLIAYHRRVRDLIKRINKRMKGIGEELGIGKITTYTARHSFATVLKRSGANISYISESLGHSDLKTTENYLASFEKDERKKNANILTQYKTVSIPEGKNI